MGNKLPVFDKLRMIGQPYHGLWKGGTITLPNSSTKSAPTPANGGVVLVRVPGMPAVTRTTEEATADTAAGREWRNYALLSGGYYGGIGPFYSNIASAHIVFVDAANSRWLMKVTTTLEWSNYMTVALKRIGHLDGTSGGWSSDVNVTIPSTFVASVHSVAVPLIGIAQNTTGREFVLGGCVNGGYANGLLKVTVSGTVNIGASLHGLSFSSEVIDYQDRLNHISSADLVVTGTCINIYSQTWNLKRDSDGFDTGTTYTQTDTYTDGVLSSNGGPPAPPSGYSWIFSSSSWSRSTDKTRETVAGYSALKNVWAGYVEDVLKIYSLEYSDLYTTNVSAVWVSSGGDTGHWEWSGTQVRVRKLISRIGSSVIHEQSETLSNTAFGQSLSSGTYGLTFTAEGMDGYEVHDSTTLAIKCDTDQVIKNGESSSGTSPITYTAKYILPIKPNGNRWASPLMVLCTRTRTSAAPNDYTFATHSVHAPSGTSVTSSIAIQDLFATWHPVLDTLTVDSENVCWF